MRRFADPGRCPSCGTPLSPGSFVCAVCSLDLSGPVGLELYNTLVRADALVAELRARSAVPVGAGAAVPPPPPAVPAAPSSPTAYPTGGLPPATLPAPVVRGSSVPKILLGLGAVCLLVAALVFLAVTWSVMGVAGRTATLVGLTSATGALTAWAARRGLRGTVEALGLVTVGLVVLDLYGADNAHWLGEPSGAVMATIVGATLVVGGWTATSALARTAAKGFTGGELAVALGAALTSVGVASQDWGTLAARQLLVVVAAAALTGAVWHLVRPGSNVHRVAGLLLVPVVVLDWTALVLIGVDALGTAPTMASVWGALDAWPLVAASVVALAMAAPRSFPMAARVVAAAGAVVPLGVALLAPASDESTTVFVLAVAGASAGLVALMLLAPRPWGAAGLAAGTLAALILVAESVVLATAALQQYLDTAARAWRGTVDGRFPTWTFVDGDKPWLLPVCVLTLAGLLWSAARLLEAGRRLRPVTVLGIVALVVAVSAVAALTLYPLPVWTAVLAALTVCGAAAWPAISRDDTAWAAVAATGLLGTCVLACYDEVLTTAALAVSLVLVGTVHLRTRRSDLAVVAGVAGVATVTGLVWTLGVVAGLAGAWTALIGLVLLSALALGRPELPVGMRTRTVTGAVEAAAACAAVPLALAGIDASSTLHASTWAAVYLTVGGASACLLAVLRPDRRRVAWLGGALLAAATWVRLADLGVDQPEPYTLPSAAALVVVGLLHLRRDPSVGSIRALGAGLGLALTPSLLWVLAEPGGWRPLLLGLACLGLVVAGARLRWAAPLVYGAVVGLLVVLREAGPYLGDSVPRWALIGAAGALLIAMGVTWEQRLRDARKVSTYVRGLR